MSSCPCTWALGSVQGGFHLPAHWLLPLLPSVCWHLEFLPLVTCRRSPGPCPFSCSATLFFSLELWQLSQPTAHLARLIAGRVQSLSRP